MNLIVLNPVISLYLIYLSETFEIINYSIIPKNAFSTWVTHSFGSHPTLLGSSQSPLLADSPVYQSMGLFPFYTQALDSVMKSHVLQAIFKLMAFMVIFPAWISLHSKLVCTYTCSIFFLEWPVGILNSMCSKTKFLIFSPTTNLILVPLSQSQQIETSFFYLTM